MKLKINTKKTLISVSAIIILTIVTIVAVNNKEPHKPTLDDLTPVHLGQGITDYYFSADDRGKDKTPSLLDCEPKLDKAMNFTEEEKASFSKAIDTIDENIVQIETRFIENNSLTEEKEITDTKQADRGYVYTADMKEEKFIEILQNLVKSGFTISSLEMQDKEHSTCSSLDEYIKVIKDNYETGFNIALEKYSNTGSNIICTYIHLPEEEEWFYTDFSSPNWDKYYYTDWLIFNFPYTYTR